MVSRRSRQQINTAVQANKGGKKLDIKKQGLSGVKNAVVKANLMGVSEKMNKKGWTDSQGRKGKVLDPAQLAANLLGHTSDPARPDVSLLCRASECTGTPTSTVLTLTDTHQSTLPTPGQSQAATTPWAQRV